MYCTRCGKKTSDLSICSDCKAKEHREQVTLCPSCGGYLVGGQCYRCADSAGFKTIVNRRS